MPRTKDTRNSRRWPKTDPAPDRHAPAALRPPRAPAPSSAPAPPPSRVLHQVRDPGRASITENLRYRRPRDHAVSGDHDPRLRNRAIMAMASEGETWRYFAENHGQLPNPPIHGQLLNPPT